MADQYRIGGVVGSLRREYRQQKPGFPAVLDERLRRPGEETGRKTGAGCIVEAQVAHGPAPVGRVAGIKDFT